MTNHVIDPRKVTHYLLAADHPQGGPKCKFFLSFGFHIQKPDELIAALMQHPVDSHVKETVTIPHGKRFIVECNLRSPDARNPCIRSVWQQDNGDTTARLITALPFH
jgi:hypothetical protein